jgi:hypothetical protein
VVEEGARGRRSWEVAHTMYAHESKCKKDKIKRKEEM